MSTHTPGPWSLDPKEDREGHRQIVRDGYALALVCMRASSPASGPRYFERDANARLIAAAPELLDACRELVVAVSAAMRVIADLDAMNAVGAEAATREERLVDELKISGVVNGFGVRANAAIAKAEGR